MAARAAAAAALAPAANAKADGTACFTRGDFAGALRGYNAALDALHGARDAHGELSCAGEAEQATCHANAAACLLKLGRHEEAYAAAMAALALPAGAANVALSSKLWARAAAALTALGETDTPRAPEAAAMPARLGLPPLGRPSAAEASALAATQRAVREALVLMFNHAAQLRTQAALRTRLLARFAPRDATAGLHVSARDAHGMPAMCGLCMGLLDGCPDARVPTTWLLREFLALGADPNARFDGGRTPLMFVAHAGDTPAALEAARLLLDAGARVNARDEGAWTPLLSALATDDRKPSWRCAKMVRLLLAAGADAAARSIQKEGGVLGQTPLLLLAANGLNSDDRLAALEALLAAMAGNGAALAARDVLGFTAAALTLRPEVQCAHNTKAHAAIVAAMRAAGVGADADADAAAMDWNNLMNAAVDANNAVAARGLADEAAGAAREQRILAALLKEAGLPPTRHGACEADPNPYLTLHSHIMRRLPPACVRLYAVPPGDDTPESGALRITTRSHGEETSARQVVAAPHLACIDVDPSPVLAWAGLPKFQELIGDACRHGFAFAVPSEAALAALAALSPLLEVGAGTGYWASLLRRRGADVLATDAAPPEAGSLSNPHHVSEAPGARVQRADGAAAAAAHPARALLLMYPCSPEAVQKLGAAAAEWDVRAIEAYQGDVVAHVGALRWRRPAAERDAAQPPEHTLCADAAAGDTTSRGAQAALRRRFTCVQTLPLPRWPLDEDALTIWVRSDKAAHAAALLAARPGVCDAGAGCACARCAAARAAGEMCGRPECGARARASGALLKVCGACKAAAYCSTECQKEDWARHKPDCKAAASAAG